VLVPALAMAQFGAPFGLADDDLPLQPLGCGLLGKGLFEVGKALLEALSHA
jgi:hypothetical protein